MPINSPQEQTRAIIIAILVAGRLGRYGQVITAANVQEQVTVAAAEAETLIDSIP